MKESIIEKENIQYYKYLLCIDEAGRGPLAGPVTIAGVLVDNNALYNITKLQYLDDSKKVSYKKRNILQDQIKNIVISYDLCNISVDIIDSINIYEATKVGIANVCENILKKNNYIENICILIDGTFSKLDNILLEKIQIKYKLNYIIKGDSMCPGIAAASILAKYHRDEIMINLDKLYPKYGFNKNKGYGTKMHIENIQKYGPCIIHRKSFSPIKDLINENINDNKKVKKINLSKFYLYYEINCFIEENKNCENDILFNLLVKRYNLEKKYISRYIKISKRIKTYLDLIGKENMDNISISFTDITTMTNEKFQNVINNLIIIS